MKHLLHRLFWTAAMYCALAGTALLVFSQHKFDMYQLHANGPRFGSDLDYLLLDQANTLSFWGVAVLVLAGWWACLAFSSLLFIRKELKQDQAVAKEIASYQIAQSKSEDPLWPFNMRSL